MPDLRGGFDPELAISLLFRSQRRPVGRPHRHRLRDAGCTRASTPSATRLRTSSNYVARLEPGVRLGLGYDGGAGTWNAAIEPRPASPVPATTNEATICDQRATRPGDEPDIVFGPPYDTRIVARDVSAELHLRELGEPSVEAIATIEGLGLVITNRWFRSLGEKGSATARGTAVQRRPRGSADRGRRLQLLGGRRAGRAHPHRQGIQAERAEADGALDPGQRPDPRDPGPASTSASRCDRTGRRKVASFTLVVDGAGGWLGWWADEPGGDKDCGGLLPPTGLGRRRRASRRSAAAASSTSPGGPNDRYAGVLSLRFGSVKGLSRFTATAFGIHELTGIPTAVDRDRSWVLVVGTSFRPGIPHRLRDLG